jgi:ABC-2 type transport system permease protein
MSLWRLEWLRLRRTWRGPGLLAMFLFFGFLGPVSARYLPDLLKHIQSNVQVIVPPPVPADGIQQYIGNVTQLGLLAVVAAAAGAFAFDGAPELAAFLRTRVPSMRRLVLTRFLAYAVAAAVVFALGAAAAWYETVVLLGTLSPLPMLAGIAYGSLYFAFAVALTALAAGIARGVLGTVVVTFVFVVVIALAGVIPAVNVWLPGRLASAIVGLAQGDAVPDYLRAALVAVAGSAASLVGAVALLGRREV